MNTQRWIRVALLVGCAYLGIGLGTSALARGGGVVWRFVAWGTSAALFFAHIAFERARIRGSSGASALHAALAVALGAFGLALAATIRAITLASYRGGYAIALVAWPVMTGVAAFVAALVVVTAVRLLRRADTPDA